MFLISDNLISLRTDPTPSHEFTNVLLTVLDLLQIWPTEGIPLKPRDDMPAQTNICLSPEYSVAWEHLT